LRGLAAWTIGERVYPPVPRLCGGATQSRLTLRRRTGAVVVGRALLLNQVLLLDEPVAGLAGRLIVREVFRIVKQ